MAKKCRVAFFLARVTLPETHLLFVRPIGNKKLTKIMDGQEINI